MWGRWMVRLGCEGQIRASSEDRLGLTVPGVQAAQSSASPTGIAWRSRSHPPVKFGDCQLGAAVPGALEKEWWPLEKEGWTELS